MSHVFVFSLTPVEARGRARRLGSPEALAGGGAADCRRSGRTLGDSVETQF